MSKVHFFCEHCGKEVKARDKVCPHCGKFFSQVRCPECDYQGPAEHFIMGCPQCGYSGHGKIEAVYEDVELSEMKKKTPGYLKKSSSPIPDWVFALVGVLFLAAFVGLVIVYMVTR
ncbi:zinc ribbon domain-containing protein [Salinispira pacifica]|uniref:DZANK-type domain-containing protein n=1 Tax=Salinispira pacifica TaxID=1307761 RepID=V5WIA2_9SPIO|nr:zinc ribbon domain-containing protein [Salinispira pacifica]AHC15294.1 hypothetical protein L21SP2_1923 [Salinispira pacifica]